MGLDYKQIMEKLKPMFEDFGTNHKEIGTRLTREEQEALEDQKVLKIKYTLFEKIILDFQLKSHHNFLKKFINLFREYDNTNLGYINEDQFEDMLDKIDSEKTLDRSKLLKQLDPYNNSVITFTHCVSVFSSEPFGDDVENQTTVLQHISSEG